MGLRVARWIAALIPFSALACGGAVAEDVAHDAGLDVARDTSLRCFPDDPANTASCPADTLCNYAWDGAKSAIACSPVPAECASDRTCDCVLAHPPAPAGQAFCGGRYCSVNDGGALVVVCAPD